MGEKLAYAIQIGKINEEITKADGLEDALKKGLQCVSSYTKATYSILWYMDSEDNSVLHPYYWIGNKDFTDSKRKFSEGVVGCVCQNERSEIYYEYKEGTDTELESNLGDEKISSMMCIPFMNQDKLLGCIQLVNTNGELYDEEMSDVVEIMTLMISIKIKEEGWFNKGWDFKNALIQIRNLRKTYKSGDTNIEVLKGIDLDIYEGEFLVILGESGCGKSTLLNIVGGMIEAESGSVLYNQKEIIGSSKDELTKYRRDCVGFIFQSYNLMPTLTVKQNIDFVGELVQSPVDSMDLLKKINLLDKKDVYPAKLSGGQQQRVSIARALVKNQQLILADEPTAALDYHTSLEILELIAEMKKEGKTLVMVTHNEEIAKMADRVIRLRDGRIYEFSINRNPLPASELVW